MTVTGIKPFFFDDAIYNSLHMLSNTVANYAASLPRQLSRSMVNDYYIDVGVGDVFPSLFCHLFEHLTLN